MFELVSSFKPAGSQPQAIERLVSGLSGGKNAQTLLGVTGSGKTFTMANVIEQTQLPALVIAHNKTLAAQLYNEFREFFPKNRVEYFVSYYDYYQPESYIPQKDQYIEKDAQINPKIEEMRLSATASLMSRQDVIIVASVSCIYGLGDPKNFEGMAFSVEAGMEISRKELLLKLVNIQYERNDMAPAKGTFRVRGDTIDIHPGFGDKLFRIQLDGDVVEKITELKWLEYTAVRTLERAFEGGRIHELRTPESAIIFPARHFVIPDSERDRAIESIKNELEEVLPTLGLVEAQRLKKRTLYDIEMIEETGYCKGIENYSRHFDQRTTGEPPYCLLNYFPKDFLMFIDESHQTIPQLHAMYNGDRSRKKALVEYGFRLPSAYDNRPLKFPEFEKNFMKKVIFVSATPAEYELKKSVQVVEQIIRPTGLVDPIVVIKPTKEQVLDLMGEIEKTTAAGNRTLVTTLTKKLAEELSEFISEKGIKVRYLHSEIDTLDRTEIIRQLRLGKFDVLVGINLLREGLDIPEVGLIGILDADKEGFLRDERSIIQTIGRAARNIDSRVILYADRMTDSIRRAMAETNRRRGMQIAYNKKHKITPKQIVKPVKEKEVDLRDTKHIPKVEIPNIIIELEARMNEAAERLEFEEAIRLRDRIRELEKRLDV